MWLPACLSVYLSDCLTVRRDVCQMRASNNNGREIRDELPCYYAYIYMIRRRDDCLTRVDADAYGGAPEDVLAFDRLH